MSHADLKKKIDSFVAKHGAQLARLPSTVSFGYQELEFFKDAEPLLNGQEGYAIYRDNELTVWNTHWIVIGIDHMVGDPIFVDSARPELPVYTAAHGQGLWIADLIADSLSSFILSLAAFNAVTENRTYPVQLDKNPLSDTERIATLERIRLLNKLDDYTFWENLLVTNWA